MRPTLKTLSVLGAAAAALCVASTGLATPAFAQDQAAPPMAGEAHHGPDRAAMEQRMQAHQARRAQRLHDLLQIHADQEPAFQAFVAEMKPPMRDHKDWDAHKTGPEQRDATGPMTTPERLDRMAAMMSKRMAERQAAFGRRADAVKKFYALLTPEQKRAFDALHEGGMGRGRMGHGMGGRPGGSGEGPDGHEHGWAS